MSLTPLEIAQQREIEKLTRINDEMRKMQTREGFFQCYFLECATSKSNKEAFEKVNEKYHELFGVYRYQDYASFKNVTNYYHKKSKRVKL